MTRRWRTFCLLATALFLCRGIFHLALFPLFEGWDEYQHVARVDYEAEHGERLLIQDERMADPLLEAFVDYPQGAGGHRHLGRMGAVTYAEFFDGVEPSYRPPTPIGRPPMYEDQQAPLYYALAAPLYRATGGSTQLLRSVTVLRLVNLALGALAVWIVLRSIGRLLRPGVPPHLLGLVAVLNPLFLQNFARVANDALAVLLGTLVIALTLLPWERRARTRALLIGLVLGAAALAKTTNLILVPFVGLALFLQARRGESGSRRGLQHVALLAVAFLLVAGREFLFNWQQYGTLTGLVFEVRNQQEGRGLADLLAAIPEVRWSWMLDVRCLRGSLWQGGWSFVPLPEMLRSLYRGILIIGVAGWVFLPRAASRRRLEFADRLTPLHLLVLLLCALAGIAYFSLQFQVAGGGGPPNAWYVVWIVPWVIGLFHQGARLLPGRWLGTLLPLSLLLLYVVTEIYGMLFVLVPYFTGGTGWADGWQRLAGMQIAGFGPLTATLALAAGLGLLAVLATVALRQGDAPQQSPPRDGSGDVRDAT